MANNAVDALLANYPPDVQALTARARAFVRKSLPAAEESVDESARLIGYACGPGYKGMICTLILSRTGIKLGLFRGAELPDPEGLLQGSGKVHRHVQLRTASDLRQPGLRRLLKEARAAQERR